MSQEMETKISTVKPCLFCKIIAKRAETFVYEDEKLVVLLSKFQTSRGHIIVTLKQHFESLDEISEHDYALLQSMVKRYHHQLMAAFQPEKIYIFLLAEEVEHIHFHLIPRYAGGTKGPAFLTEQIVEVEHPEDIIKEINAARATDPAI